MNTMTEAGSPVVKRSKLRIKISLKSIRNARIEKTAVDNVENIKKDAASRPAPPVFATKSQSASPDAAPKVTNEPQSTSQEKRSKEETKSKSSTNKSNQKKSKPKPAKKTKSFQKLKNSVNQARTFSAAQSQVARSQIIQGSMKTMNSTRCMQRAKLIGVNMLRCPLVR